MDTLGGVFSAALAAYLVYVRTAVDASNAGFSLNMAVAFSGCILWVSSSLVQLQRTLGSDLLVLAVGAVPQ